MIPQLLSPGSWGLLGNNPERTFRGRGASTQKSPVSFERLNHTSPGNQTDLNKSSQSRNEEDTLTQKSLAHISGTWQGYMRTSLVPNCGLFSNLVKHRAWVNLWISVKTVQTWSCWSFGTCIFFWKSSFPFLNIVYEMPKCTLSFSYSVNVFIYMSLNKAHRHPKPRR